MPTSSVNNETGVQLYHSFSPSDSLFPVPVNVVVCSVQVIPSSSWSQGAPLSSMCLVVSTCQQKLVLLSRVTPIDAQKLRHELPFHPDQVKVDYGITGLTSVFHLGFDPSVSLKFSHWWLISTLQVRFPWDKFERITALLESWSTKQHCTRKELESLIGTPHHACKVIPQGYTFIRCMINLLLAFRWDNNSIRLNQEIHLDLSWWHEFFISWDGLSFLLSPHLGTWFLGVIWHSWSSWLQYNFFL